MDKETLKALREYPIKSFESVERELSSLADPMIMNTGFDYGYDMAGKHPEEELLVVASMAESQIPDGSHHEYLQSKDEFILGAVCGAFVRRKQEAEEQNL